jgi:methylase of polypeptide subunit release factors
MGGNPTGQDGLVDDAFRHSPPAGQLPALLLGPDDVARLREALGTAGYTSEGIAARIGPSAVNAVRRNDFRALLRATSERDRLATLVRVFIAGQTESAGHIEAALAPLPLAAAVEAGLVEPYGDGLHAGLDLDVHTGRTGTDWWVLSDLDTDARPGPLRTDHVLGIGNAATTLADATVRAPVGSALDLGTGCGVQALQLSTHAGAVTATDLSDRALRFAATTAALNGLRWELLAGDMLVPVAGRRFDLVVSNPPFVVGPAATRYTYRDSGRAGDALCTELAAAAPVLLNEGGTLQFLANWLHVSGEDWHERVAGWVADSGCDAWIVQREISDPVEYVNLWLRDAAEPFDPARAPAWLDWFDANKVEAVGFGVVTIRRSGREQAVVRVEELRQRVEPPLGRRIEQWFTRQSWLAAQPSILDTRPVRAPGITLTQEAGHDGDDWAVHKQVLTLADGLRWSEEVDPVALALVSGADGSVPVRDLVAVLAQAFDTPEPVLAAMSEPVVAHLVERGYLIPADARAPR